LEMAVNQIKREPKFRLCRESFHILFSKTKMKEKRLKALVYNEQIV